MLSKISSPDENLIHLGVSSVIFISVLCELELYTNYFPFLTIKEGYQNEEQLVPL